MGFELRKTLSPQNFHLNEKLSRKKSHSQRMSLFLLNLNILDEKCPIPRAFDKKKKKNQQQFFDITDDYCDNKN